jgi:hypothetical protein
LPACEAWIVQVPEASSEAVVPETVQIAGVVDAKFTARPDVAVAERAAVDPAIWLAATVANEIVCDA